MKYLLQFCGGLALALLCLLTYDLDQTVVDVRCQIPAAVEKINHAAESYNARGQEISDETLDLIGSAKQLIANLNKSALKLPELVQNLNTTTGKLPALVASGTATLNTFNGAITEVSGPAGKLLTGLGATNAALTKGIADISDQSVQTLDTVNLAASHADQVIADQNIPLLVSHAQGMTASGDSMLKNAARIVDEKTNPAPQSRAKRYAIGAFEWLTRILEAGYYAHGL